jgi:FeS assembly SUF system protein
MIEPWQNFMVSLPLQKFIKMDNRNSPIQSPFEAKVIAALRSVFDPEIPVNIYDLGLIYNLQINEQTNDVSILMTLTTPNCPVAEDMPGEVQDAVKLVEGVGSVKVELTFEPPWDKEMLSESALLDLGLL